MHKFNILTPHREENGDSKERSGQSKQTPNPAVPCPPALALWDVNSNWLSYSPAFDVLTLAVHTVSLFLSLLSKMYL